MPLLVRGDPSQGRRQEPRLFTWARDPAKPAGNLKIILLHVGPFFALHGGSKQENTAWQECQGRQEDTHKSRHKAANDMFEDNSSTNLGRHNENNRLNTPLKHDVAEVDEVPVTSGGLTTKFLCKVCGNTFDDRDGLNQHLAGLHHPKRTVTASDIVNGVFEGGMNFPKTKAEIVKSVTDRPPAVTPQVIDTIRSMPDKLYYNKAELICGIE
jgi:hypothetical protein